LFSFPDLFLGVPPPPDRDPRSLHGDPGRHVAVRAVPPQARLPVHAAAGQRVHPGPHGGDQGEAVGQDGGDQGEVLGANGGNQRTLLRENGSDEGQALREAAGDQRQSHGGQVVF